MKVWIKKKSQCFVPVGGFDDYLDYEISLESQPGITRSNSNSAVLEMTACDSELDNIDLTDDVELDPGKIREFLPRKSLNRELQKVFY